MKKVLMLTGASTDPGLEVKALIREFQKSGVKAEVRRSRDLSYVLDTNGNDHVYAGPVELNLDDYFCIFSGAGMLNCPKYLVQPCRDHGVQMFGTPEEIDIIKDKYLTHRAMMKAGIRTTDYNMVINKVNAKILPDLQKTVGAERYPYVIKPIGNHHGIDVYLIESPVKETVKLRPSPRKDNHILVQNCITTSAYDDRYYVIDGKVVTLYRRNGKPENFVSNMVRGGYPSAVEPRPDSIELVERCSKLFPSVLVQAYDVVYDENDVPHIIEVNTLPNWIRDGGTVSHPDKVTKAIVKAIVDRMNH